MFIKGILFFFLEIVCGYNIDVDFPIIFHHDNMFNNSYFGYTVHLYYESDIDTSWLIVGAPKGNYSWSSSKRLSYLIEPGIVYRCEIENSHLYRGIENHKCQEIKPEKIENEKGYITQLGMMMWIRKQYGWFGSAIAIDRINGILTACAPRTIVALLYKSLDNNLETMQGMCYSGKISSNTLIIEEKDLKFYDFMSTFWYNPIHGFSVHYASTKQNEKRKKKKINRIIGEPKHEDYGTVDIQYSNKRMTVQLPLNDDLSQFGYSVESGYFFKRDQLLFASGAPGWKYKGSVGIINPASNISIITKLYGTHIGEYFGASLAVGDLNKDGLDDLLIGAPYWGEDTGRVYIYLGTSKEQFEMAVILHGVAEGGHFGYAIASGDLDADGYDDIIVGTPWEDDGVVYVFNGTPDLKNTNLKKSQRIEAVKLFKYNSSRRILRFGFSISKPIDIDKNGYLDIAIGAYKSDHAIILRSKPIWKTELFIETIPNILQRNAKQFLVRICPRYNMYGMLHDIVTDTIKFRITAIIDERYQRTKETILEMKSSNLSICLSSEVNILKDIRDFIEPISIVAKHDFLHDNVSNEFCKFCPVEKHNKIQNVKVLLPFNIGCGEDKICNSNISVTAKFYNVRDNDMWIIGSNDISLKINLKNYGEPAYLTILEFKFPERVILRSILPSCQEDISKENLIVICDVGNPIWKEEEKNVKLDLNMRYLINGSLHDHKLYFYITIKTRSINHGMTSIIKTLNLVNEVSLSLHGKPNEEAYYLTTLNEIAQNVTFQHTYQVYKLGASPIEVAQLIVKIPLTFKDLHLIYMYKSQLYISGELFECSSETNLLDIQGESSLEQFDISLFSNKIRQNNNYIINEKDQFNSIEGSALYLNNMNIKAPKILNENWTNDIIYMNCSTPYINCITIICDLNTLKTLQDIGKMTIEFFLNVDKLKDIFKNNRAILKYATEVSAKIIKPDKMLYINGTRSTMEIVTIFYNIPKMEKLQPWIILISILIGILLLFIFAAILGTLGFFKRKKKQALTNQECNEMIENETAINSENT